MASSRPPTVVIPYKRNESNELGWALKSLDNVEHEEVLVIEDYPKPFWASYSGAHDQIAKYYHACQVSDAEELILSNDDFFIMEAWEPANYNRGTLEEHIKERGRSDSYTRQLHTTNGYLKRRNIGNLSFELHTPMIVNREQFKHAIEELIPHISKSRQNVVLIRSYYGNRYKIKSTRIEDVKNPKNPEGMTLLSTTERTFRGELGDYIKAKLS